MTFITMKVFLGLGVLYLLVGLSWTQDPTVTVECSLLTLRVMVKKHLFNDVPVAPEELMLGTGCPVTGETSAIYELHYPVSECGIHFEAFQTLVLYKTTLYYKPTNPFPALTFPLFCTVFKKLFLPKLNDPVRVLPPQEAPTLNGIKMRSSVSVPSYWNRDFPGMLVEQGIKSLQNRY
ncbi:oocyte-secreted protein 3-like [Monodelphis domestica]|uniref:oocyte-secreted protein 3-like n=1 Tax=Monodelphis domestica TaxID=13616 RepID=UPI0024E24BF9|nr:oocyte-secreted protein 3-like [Monodelphis domestica]